MAIPIEQETVSSVFRHLVDESKKTISKIHEDTKISEMTLYSLYNRENKKADLRMLKTLADILGWSWRSSAACVVISPLAGSAARRKCSSSSSALSLMMPSSRSWASSCG